MHRLGVKLPLNDNVSFSEAFSHVPKAMAKALDHVTDLTIPLPQLFGSEAAVEQRRLRLGRLRGRKHRRQHLVVHLDQRCGLFGDVWAGRSDGGDGVALVQRLIAGEDIISEEL